MSSGKADVTTDLGSLFTVLHTGLKPNWTFRYKVGVMLSKHLDPVCELELVAAHFGTTKQRMYHETVSALGTLACRLYQRLNVKSAVGLEKVLAT